MNNRKNHEQIEPEAIDTSREKTVDAEHKESPILLSPYASEQPIPPFSPANISKYTWYEMDESSLPLLATLDPVSRRTYERLGYLPGPMRYDLGSFQIDEHHTVSFEVIPSLGEVSYSEIIVYPPGLARPPEKIDEGDSPTPLMRFLQLTDKDVPVPIVLQEFDDRSDAPEVERALARRDVVDSMDNYGKQSSVFLAAPQAPSADEPPAVWTCFSGGGDVFSSTYCESKGIWFCGSQAWNNLTRHTGTKRRWVSHSRVAACGGSFFTYVEHQFRIYSWWQAKYVWLTVKYPLTPDWFQLLPPGHVKYWKHVGNKKHRRKIRIWTSGSSYFRAWTAFYN